MLVDRKINLIVLYLRSLLAFVHLVLHAFFVRSYSLSVVTIVSFVVCYRCLPLLLSALVLSALLFSGLFKPHKSTAYIDQDN